MFYRDVPKYGPQGQDAFVTRFPMSAQDAASISGSLHFSNFYRWTGRCRELAPINNSTVFETMFHMLGSNDVVPATNHMETRIFQTPDLTDIVEARLYNEYVHPADAGTVIEWWRFPINREAAPEMFAWTKFRTSAVKVQAHGVVKRTKWPDFFFGYMQRMGRNAPTPILGPENKIELGALLYESTLGPQDRSFIYELTFDTTLENSNLVGNIYFANYGIWQSQIRDKYFYRLCPNRYYQNRGAEGELTCIETSVQQLRDVMPFAQIKVQLQIYSIYERAVDFRLSYFRVENDNALTKVAAGRHLAIWAVIERGMEIKSKPWPSQIREALQIEAKTTR